MQLERPYSPQKYAAPAFTLPRDSTISIDRLHPSDQPKSVQRKKQFQHLRRSTVDLRQQQQQQEQPQKAILGDRWLSECGSQYTYFSAVPKPVRRPFSRNYDSEDPFRRGATILAPLTQDDLRMMQTGAIPTKILPVGNAHPHPDARTARLPSRRGSAIPGRGAGPGTVSRARDNPNPNYSSVQMTRKNPSPMKRRRRASSTTGRLRNRRGSQGGQGRRPKRGRGRGRGGGRERQRVRDRQQQRVNQTRGQQTRGREEREGKRTGVGEKFHSSMTHEERAAETKRLAEKRLQRGAFEDEDNDDDDDEDESESCLSVHTQRLHKGERPPFAMYGWANQNPVKPENRLRTFNLGCGSREKDALHPYVVPRRDKTHGYKEWQKYMMSTNAFVPRTMEYAKKRTRARTPPRMHAAKTSEYVGVSDYAVQKNPTRRSSETRPRQPRPEEQMLEEEEESGVPFEPHQVSVSRRMSMPAAPMEQEATQTTEFRPVVYGNEEWNPKRFKFLPVEYTQFIRPAGVGTSYSGETVADCLDQYD